MKWIQSYPHGLRKTTSHLADSRRNFWFNLMALQLRRLVLLFWPPRIDLRISYSNFLDVHVKDEAARRRFSRRVYVPLPEPATRAALIQHLLQHHSHSLNALDIDQVVNKTQGFFLSMTSFLHSLIISNYPLISFKAIRVLTSMPSPKRPHSFRFEIWLPSNFGPYNTLTFDRSIQTISNWPFSPLKAAWVLSKCGKWKPGLENSHDWEYFALCKDARVSIITGTNINAINSASRAVFF